MTGNAFSPVLAVALGGAAGALARYWMSAGVYRWLGTGFPFGTLAVNVIGSLLMGVLFVIFQQRGGLAEGYRLGLLVGVLGAFTTFSTFSIDTLVLVQQGAWLKAGLNVVVSVAACLAACAAGIALTRSI